MKAKHLLTTIAVTAAFGLSAEIPTPTMGWSSWNTFALDINEDLIRSQADAMVSTGLAKAGYNYINVDDGYWNGRGEDGVLRVNEALFPSGMRALSDYIHSLGLKAGIYSDTGLNCCGSRNTFEYGLGVGFLGHEYEDAKLYIDDWNFDFIKVDNCNGSGIPYDERDRYTAISRAVKACQRDSVTFNICCGFYPGVWVNDVAKSWRTTYDIECNWESLVRIITENLYIQAFTGDGHYNDCDMLEIGRTLTPDEENTHMVYWCIASSPLLIGCDLTSIPASSLALLSNPDLIAMNQNRLGIGAPVVQRFGEVYVFAKDMDEYLGPRRAVAVVNLTDTVQRVPLDLAALGFTGKVSIYDCIHRNKISGKFKNTYEVEVPAHGSCAYFIDGKRAERKAYQAEEAWWSAYSEKAGRPSPWPRDDADATLGVYVDGLGGSYDNYIEWRNVESIDGGEYTLAVRYKAVEPSAFTLICNGKNVDTKHFTPDAEAAWQTVEFPVTLTPGQNVISLQSPALPIPHLDEITITKK